MVGAYIAATVVTLLQYLRLRERRLLPLAALFAFQAEALNREWWDVWWHVSQGAACVAGLLLLVVLTLRHPAAVKPDVRHAPSESTPAKQTPDTPQPSA